MKRILHVGLGPLGQRVLADMHDRSLGHLVAAVDLNPACSGKPVSTIVPAVDPRVTVLPSLDAVDCWDTIDCVLVTTTSDLPSCADTFRALLRRGKPVVSSCEELVYPWLRHVGLSEELDDVAKRHGGRLLGTGVNPGFLMDALPAAVTAVSKSVRAVSCHRIQDASSRRIPFQKKIGAGLDDAQFAAKVREGTLRHVGLGESLHFIAHYLGLTIERWEEDLTPVHATRDLTCGLGPIPRGRVCGVRQVARGFHDERTVVHMEFQAAIGQDDPHDRVVIDGEPPIDLVIRGGVHGDVATSAILLNAIGPIMRAAPGLHTMATVTPVMHAAR